MTGEHIKMAILVIVGIVTVIGLVIAAAVETKRMDEGKGSILPSASKDTDSREKS